MVRAATGQDSPSTRVTQVQVQAWVQEEYVRFRREIISTANTLYSRLSATQALTTADPLFDLPADFDRLIRFERQEGDRFLGLEVANSLHPEIGWRAFAEEDGKLRVSPPDIADGTYRLLYNYSPTLTGNYTIEVPDGCEEVIVERVAAKARRRLEEDPTQHLAEASRIWNGEPGRPGTGQKTAIRRRYGNHPEPGQVPVRGW